MKKVVVLKLSKTPVAQKIANAKVIVTSMTGNSYFATPAPALATITAQTSDFEAAYIAALSGGPDKTADMHAKEHILDLSLTSLGAYVEGIANDGSADPDAVILSAGMEVKDSPVHTTREFHVNATGNPGEVKLATRGEKRATFIWQMTTDPSVETNWATIGQATRAKMIKNGLLSGVRYFFRVAFVDKGGLQPWSNVLNTVVL